MRKYDHISDILNTIPNSYVASYKAQQRAEVDEVIAIHQKYGIFPYPGTCKSISLYDKEVTAMGITLLENINKAINTCVTIKKGQQYESWDYARGNCAQRFAIHRIFILKQTNLKNI